MAPPNPQRTPTPPIWIGAQGDTTLRLTARHADVWNISGGDPAFVKDLVAKFDEICVAVGRNPAEGRRSLQYGWDVNDRQDLLDLSCRLLELGLTAHGIY